MASNNVMVQVSAALHSFGRLFSQSNQDSGEAGHLLHLFLNDLAACDGPRRNEGCGVDPACSISVRRSVAKPSSAFDADPKQATMRGVPSGVVPTKQMHLSSHTTLSVEGMEIRKDSGPRARELRHAQLAMERASERKGKLCAMIAVQRKELLELKNKALTPVKFQEESITEEQIAHKENELDNTRNDLRKVTNVLQEAGNFIEKLRGPLQEERVKGVALFISHAHDKFDKPGRNSST
jgi:hypothetical protein